MFLIAYTKNNGVYTATDFEFLNKIIFKYERSDVRFFRTLFVRLRCQIAYISLLRSGSSALAPWSFYLDSLANRPNRYSIRMRQGLHKHRHVCSMFDHSRIKQMYKYED